MTARELEFGLATWSRFHPGTTAKWSAMSRASCSTSPAWSIAPRADESTSDPYQLAGISSPGQDVLRRRSRTPTDAYPLSRCAAHRRLLAEHPVVSAVTRAVASLAAGASPPSASLSDEQGPSRSLTVRDLLPVVLRVRGRRAGDRKRGIGIARRRRLPAI